MGKHNQKKQKNCGSGSGTCFPSDTPILTKEGYVPIQTIRVGDDIYSREERTGETGFQKVEEVFLRSVHTIYTIEVNTTTKIQTTSRHPFYVEGEGWVIANQLQVGMNLQTLNGTAAITDLRKERTDEVVSVYNFRVSEWSSYFVSEWNVYVHNAGDDYDGKGKPKIKGDSRKPDINKIIDSASQPKKGGETVAGHALQKHAGRNPTIWGKVSGNSENINNTAMQHINDILNGSGDFNVVESNGRSFLEKMLSDGRGIRLNMDGTFKGFIDQIRQ